MVDAQCGWGLQERTQVGHDERQLVGGDITVPVLIEDLERLTNLLLLICILEFLRHHRQEFLKINRSIAVCVHLIDLR